LKGKEKGLTHLIGSVEDWRRSFGGAGRFCTLEKKRRAKNSTRRAKAAFFPHYK